MWELIIIDMHLIVGKEIPVTLNNRREHKIRKSCLCVCSCMENYVCMLTML